MRSHPTAGQASIEYLGAIALVALVFILAAPAVGAPSIAGSVVAQIKHGLCLVGGDFCTTSDARRAGLAPCPLRSDISGGEGSLTVFSVEIGGRTTLMVTPLSDGTFSVVRTLSGSVGAVGGPDAGLSFGPVRFEAGAEGSVRGRLQAARGWVFPDRATVARFVADSRRGELDAKRWPWAWESGDLGRELGAWVGAVGGVPDKASISPGSASAGLQHALGVKRSRDGSQTFYARVALDSAEIAFPLLPPVRTDGRAEWVLEYTRKDGRPRELVLRSAIPSEGAHEVHDTVARLDLRDPTSMAVARPFLESPATWATAGGPGKRALLDRIATHGIVERTVSAVEDRSRGLSASAKLGFKFGLGGKQIKIQRRLIEATAVVGGGLAGKRLDCLARPG